METGLEASINADVAVVSGQSFYPLHRHRTILSPQVSSW